MNNSKVAIVVSQIIEKIEIIAGGLWAFMFIVVALMGMFDSEKDGAGVIITMWIFGLFGIWVVWKGIRRKKMRLEFKKYVAELSYNPTGTIDNLAAATDTSVDVVKKNLKFMIKKDIFQMRLLMKRRIDSYYWAGSRKLMVRFRMSIIIILLMITNNRLSMLPAIAKIAVELIKL